VVNEEPATYLCPWVYLDPGQKPIDVGEKAAQEKKVVLPQEASYPMQPKSVQARITADHLQNGLGRWIFIKDSLNILFYPLVHPICSPPFGMPKPCFRLQELCFCTLSRSQATSKGGSHVAETRAGKPALLRIWIYWFS
jgi:hypothetical protein